MKPGQRVAGSLHGKKFTGEVQGATTLDEELSAVYIKLDSPITDPQGRSIRRVGITGDDIENLTEL